MASASLKGMAGDVGHAQGERPFQTMRGSGKSHSRLINYRQLSLGNFNEAFTDSEEFSESSSYSEEEEEKDDMDGSSLPGVRGKAHHEILRKDLLQDGTPGRGGALDDANGGLLTTGLHASGVEAAERVRRSMEKGTKRRRRHRKSALGTDKYASDKRTRNHARLDYALLGKACADATGVVETFHVQLDADKNSSAALSDPNKAGAGAGAGAGGVNVATEQVTPSFFAHERGRLPAVCRAKSEGTSTAAPLGIELPEDAETVLTPEWFAVNAVHVFDGSTPPVRTTDVRTQAPGPTLTPAQWAAYWNATVKERDANANANANAEGLLKRHDDDNDADNGGRTTPVPPPQEDEEMQNPLASPATPACPPASTPPSIPPELSKKHLNVVSLNLSGTQAADILTPPTVVTRVDLHRDAQGARVNLYALMTPPEAYTDWHLDFGGSAVWYHVVSGSKVFLAAPPTSFNLDAFESWAGTSRQRHMSLLPKLQGVVRLVVNAGDTLFLPGGWSHCVYTPVPTVALGGNFLTRRGFGISLDIWRLEDRLGVRPIARFPGFAAVSLREADRLVTAMRRAMNAAAAAAAAAANNAGEASEHPQQTQPVEKPSEPEPKPKPKPAAADDDVGCATAPCSGDAVPAEAVAAPTMENPVKTDDATGPQPDEDGIAVATAGAGVAAELPIMLRVSMREKVEPDEPNAENMAEANDTVEAPSTLRVVRIKAPEAPPPSLAPPLRVRLAVAPMSAAANNIHSPPRDTYAFDDDGMGSPSSISAAVPAVTSLSAAPNANPYRASVAAGMDPIIAAASAQGKLHRVASACGDTAPETAAVGLKVRLRLDAGSPPSAAAATLPPADAIAAAVLPSMLVAFASSPDHLTPARLIGAGESPPGTPTAPFPAPADLRARAASLLEWGGEALAPDVRFPAAEALPYTLANVASTPARLPAWWWEARRGPVKSKRRGGTSAADPFGSKRGGTTSDGMDSDEWDGERPRKARRRSRAPSAPAPVNVTMPSVKIILKGARAPSSPTPAPAPAPAPASGPPAASRSHAPSQGARTARPAVSARSRLEKKLKRWK